MRISNTQQQARPQYYDRNPTYGVAGTEVGIVVPHALTQRWSYTVPVGRKSRLESLYTMMTRASAAAPVGQCRWRITYTPSGGPTGLLVQSIYGNNGVLTSAEVYTPALGEIGAGDTVTASSQDQSTGGTVEFTSLIKHVEFDI